MWGAPSADAPIVLTLGAAGRGPRREARGCKDCAPLIDLRSETAYERTRVPDLKPSRRLTCKQVAHRTTEFLEGRLAGTSRARFVRHLEACSACCTYVQQIALTRAGLHQLPGEQMPARMRATLLERLAKRTKLPGPASGDS